MDIVRYQSTELPGRTGRLLRNITGRWLLGLRQTNPALLDMFRDRDKLPYRRLLSWSGEFIGKHLTSTAFVYRITVDERLRQESVELIRELLTYQDEDGYLGCFSKKCHLTGAFSQTPEKTGGTWDAWNHYHVMYGLLQWYDLTGDETFFRGVERAAALFLNTFYGEKDTLLSIGSTEMNLAIYHMFAILYRRTGDERYLRFAKLVENDIETDGGGKYLHYALTGLPYYQCPKPRWESLHAVMGYAELYRATGEEKYKEAICQIFYSILDTDVHNTGAFSTDEQAVGQPCKKGAIETCCVVAYNALALEVYGLTGDSRVLDFLERAHYNAVMGFWSPTGRWATYDTPMEGTKRASADSIQFQCRPGSPELNCCSVNAPRGAATVGEWWMTRDGDTLFLNGYEDGTFVTDRNEKITITGGYPAASTVHISVEGMSGDTTLALRIPGWSANTAITVAGQTVRPDAGGYWRLPAVSGEITVTFDFTPVLDRATGDFEGKTCVYAGPILYGFDVSDNEIVCDDLPVLSRSGIETAKPEADPDGSIRIHLPEGVVLKDFYHLGVSGSWYSTWLPIEE